MDVVGEAELAGYEERYVCPHAAALGILSVSQSGGDGRERS